MRSKIINPETTPMARDLKAQGFHFDGMQHNGAVFQKIVDDFEYRAVVLNGGRIVKYKAERIHRSRLVNKPMSKLAKEKAEVW